VGSQVNELAGKVALVTGASKGMGAATASLFAAEGAQVLVVDVDVDGGLEVVADITAAGGDASFLRVDVSSSEDVRTMVATAVERYGRLDCAVNNAAIGSEGVRLVDVDESVLDRLLTVNLKSVALCMKYELQAMLGSSRGSIVNVGSVNSFRPQVGEAVYTATKHGVIGLTKAASLENAPLGVRVNAVCPGPIDTPMLKDAMGRLGFTSDQLASHMSLFGRLGRPEEVAEANLWLCSDRSSLVTGMALAADAGYLNR
jgi:NAD(P)-dependent dehydrogenase (short-subunit alcohol dehydrogenase family)